jgi:toxin CcdB
MQYDIYPNPSPRMRDTYPYVVDIQSDLLSSLHTRMVMPLSITQLAANQVPRKLCPMIRVKGQKLMLIPYEAAPLDKKLLKKKSDSAKEQASEIIAAIDAVVSGI